MSLILPTSPISSILCLKASRLVIIIAGSLSDKSILLFSNIMHNFKKNGAVLDSNFEQRQSHASLQVHSGMSLEYPVLTKLNATFPSAVLVKMDKTMPIYTWSFNSPSFLTELINHAQPSQTRFEKALCPHQHFCIHQPRVYYILSSLHWTRTSQINSSSHSSCLKIQLC